MKVDKHWMYRDDCRWDMAHYVSIAKPGRRSTKQQKKDLIAQRLPTKHRVKADDTEPATIFRTLYHNTKLTPHNQSTFSKKSMTGRCLSKTRKGCPWPLWSLWLGQIKCVNQSTNIELYSFDCKAWQAFKATTKMDLIARLLRPGI